MATGWTLTGLADYIKENPSIELVPVVLNLGTLDSGASLQDGIKSSEKITAISDDEAIIQAVDYTSSTATGGITLANKTISVTERHIKENYLPAPLNAKVTQLALRAGSEIDDLPAYLVEKITSGKLASIAKKNEQSLWLGDTAATGTTASTRHLLDFDGYIKLAQTSSDTVKTAASAIALTAANAIAQLALTHSLLPEDMLSVDVTHYMSISNFNMARQAYMTLYKSTQVFEDNLGGQKFTYQVPGTNITLRGMTGLAGSNDRLLCEPRQLIVGVDLKSDEETVEMRKLENRSFELFGLYKIGCQIGLDAEIVVTKVGV